MIFGGTGLGGAGFPILANFLLERVGFRWTLRTLAALIGVLGGLALLGAKPRLPVARHATPAPMSFSFATSPVFIFMVSALAFRQLWRKTGANALSGAHHLRARAVIFTCIAVYSILRSCPRLLKLERNARACGFQSCGCRRTGYCRLLL